MPKAEWGKKVVCASCEVKFYNLNRKPAICPNCGAEYNDLANDAILNNTKQVFNDNVDVVSDNNLVGSNAAESIADDEEIHLDDAMDEETISLEETDGEVEDISSDVNSLDINENNSGELEEE